MRVTVLIVGLLKGGAMPYALQLYFDPSTDATVRQLWRRFEGAGIAGHLVETANRPHLTLVIYDDLDVVTAERELLLFVPTLAPFPVTFAHVGVFTQPSPVVFLAPVVTIDLLDLHQVTHERFAGFGTGPHPFYLPRRWTPHCTIALHVDRQTLPLSMEVTQEISLPMTGTVTELGIVRVSPTSPLSTVCLGAPE